MGFFKSMLNEAGRKTGSAIGNKLFPKSTDYIRLGSLGNDQEELLEAEHEAALERLEVEQQSELLLEVMRLYFEPGDLDHNIAVLSQLSSIIDSLPSRFNRSELEQKVYRMAKSKIESGLTICKEIAPQNSTVAFFERKYLK